MRELPYANHDSGTLPIPSKSEFKTLDGQSQSRSSYFLVNFSGPQDVVSFFLNDFETAIQTADAFDANVIFETEAISETYRDLVVPIIRQVMTTLDITISKSSDGSWNTTDVSAFMYDLGLIGFNGPNPLDMLYAAFPALLYLNPSIGGFLLKPSLELHNTSVYTLPYAGTNLGYPNVTLKNKPHNFGIETSSSMIIMVLAHFRASGDPSLILQYYDLLNDWAIYLVETAMNPGNQTTSPGDFVPLTNQTNLSLKGIIAIAAMAKISDRFGSANDSSTFQKNANSLMQQWMTSSISNSGERILSVFGQQDSGGVIYNMYADKWLGLNLIPDTIYGLQTSFYASQFALRTNAFGMPLDLSVADVSRADWIVFAAAATTDNTTRDTMLAAVHRYISSGINDSPLGPLYDPTTGGTPIASVVQGRAGPGCPEPGLHQKSCPSPSFIAGNTGQGSGYRGLAINIIFIDIFLYSPAMGAMFSLLALTNTSFNGSSITAPSPSPTAKNGSANARQTHTKVITIAIAGAAGGAVIAGCVLYFLCRIRQKKKELVLPSDSSNANQPGSTPAQTDNHRRSTVDPHPHILFNKLPEVPIVRPEKRRNENVFMDASGPLPASSDITSSSQTTRLPTDVISSLSEALQLPDEQDRNINEVREMRRATGTTFDASRVLVIGGDGGEGTVVFSEAPPSYEE
ncbi:hypothetical protein SCHPADRAFT_947174 [Schizopora paradoxa]|uniref:Glutaminase A central domain-containing protein n=1 Tax=Schizopora paradoxa TaxID=27342 RepID=A0A0H2R6J6_9AGAM|nr:hypothetical protein SCHPADRAFT_947174 [Schizopora paradoxa]